MEEMLKDLNRVLKSFHPLGDDALLGFVIITFGDGDVFTVAPGNIANRLTERGYVKVVRCGQCRWLEERVVWQAAGGEASKMYICKSPHSHMKGIARFDGDYYCSEGEAKEGTNA